MPDTPTRRMNAGNLIAHSRGGNQLWIGLDESKNGYWTRQLGIQTLLDGMATYEENRPSCVVYEHRCGCEHHAPAESFVADCLW